MLGAEASKTNDTNLTTSGFSVTYDPASKNYVMAFPASQPGAFKQYVYDIGNSKGWAGALVPSSGAPFDGVFVRKATINGTPLSFTAIAEYGYLYQNQPAGVLAFGSATPPNAGPVAGSATYSALVDGLTIDGAGYITGSATLQFDFGAGKLTGHFDPNYVSLGGIGDQISLGRYDFANTVYSSGSTSFSGQLSNSQLSGKGAFNGQFTGPHAEELMSRWTAPYMNPDSHTLGTMFGVWVGKH